MENAINFVSDFSECGGRCDCFRGNAVTANGESGNEGEISGPYESRISLLLDELPWTNKNSPKLQDRKSLSGSGRYSCFNIEEGYLQPLVTHHHFFYFIFLLILQVQISSLPFINGPSRQQFKKEIRKGKISNATCLSRLSYIISKSKLIN